MFLIVAFGMRLGGACVSSIAYANAVFLVVFSVWAWSIARTRMSAALSFLFSLYVGFMIAATSVHGHSFKQLGYSALYNRYGVVLTALVFLEALGSPRKQFRPWAHALQGLSTGIALAIAFFLKLNFFGVATWGIMAGLILVPQHRYRWMGLCVGALVVSLALLAYLRFDVAAIYHDVHTAAKLRGVGFARNAFGIMTDPLVFNVAFLMLTLLCIAPAPSNYYRSWFSPACAQGLLVLFLMFVQLVLSLTNTQPPLPTLFPVAALLILEAGRRTDISLKRSTGWLATMLLAFYFIATILVPDITSLPYSVFMREGDARQLAPDQKFTAPPLADLLVLHDPDYARTINDGCQLLQAKSQPTDRIVTMDLCNPFSYALQRIPPTGDAIYWNQQTFSKSIHLDPERVFADATVVMVPKKPIELRPERQPMDVYASYVDAHYTLAAGSTFWKLYQRRSK